MTGARFEVEIVNPADGKPKLWDSYSTRERAETVAATLRHHGFFVQVRVDEAMIPPDKMCDADLRAELIDRLHGRERDGWQWIHYAGRTIRSATFTADGTAHADGEPERVALEAMVSAHRRLAERRSKSAKQAAETRERRRGLEVQSVVRVWMRDGKLPPAPNCRICGKALGDDDSRGRGIGSECWQRVLCAIEAAKAEAAP